ncbi:hypothetical protein QQF64_026166 [Cirrhinus molitorella]|uniref:Uncharacterized protein n=1 Tax=Cirrhinus molitorella TaxID=172907 RepID=A0ABR3NR44_9TELE
MDPAITADLRDFCANSSARMEKQEEQMLATGRAVQALVAQDEPVDLSNMPAEYLDLKGVFSKSRAASLPPHRPYDCAIDLLSGSKNIKPDALSRVFDQSERPLSPELILPKKIVVSTLTWEIESKVRRALQGCCLATRGSPLVSTDSPDSHSFVPVFPPASADFPLRIPRLFELDYCCFR